MDDEAGFRGQVTRHVFFSAFSIETAFVILIPRKVREIMSIGRPSKVVFLISLALLLASVAVRYGGVDIPFVNRHVYEVLLGGFVLLVLGNLLKGL